MWMSKFIKHFKAYTSVKSQSVGTSSSSTVTDVDSAPDPAIWCEKTKESVSWIISLLMSLPDAQGDVIQNRITRHHSCFIPQVSLPGINTISN